MWKKIALGGAVAAAIVGVGTAAVATSGSSSGSPSASADRPGHPAAMRAARHMVHGQFVTRGEDSTFVTHDVIRGQVTDVSATSISVKAADGVTQKYTVTADTKIRIRTNGTGKDGTISDVHDSAQVLVIGTGSSTYTAKRIVVRG